MGSALRKVAPRSTSKSGKLIGFRCETGAVRAASASKVSPVSTRTAGSPMAPSIAAATARRYNSSYLFRSLIISHLCAGFDPVSLAAPGEAYSALRKPVLVSARRKRFRSLSSPACFAALQLRATQGQPRAQEGRHIRGLLSMGPSCGATLLSTACLSRLHRQSVPRWGRHSDGLLSRLLALLWQIKSSERILTAGRLGDLGSRRHGGLGRGS
jgi:hypothetical protein